MAIRVSPRTSPFVRIAIVSGDSGFAVPLADFLRAQPRLRVVAVTYSPAMLIQQLRTTQPDVIILELAELDFSSESALRKVRAQFPAAGIVVVTRAVDTATFLDARRYGANAVVTKGLMDAELVKVIRQAAHRVRR